MCADLRDVSELKRYLGALREGYTALAQAMVQATELGAVVPPRLTNEVNMGRYQAEELAQDFDADPQSLLSPPYAPLTEAALASQSRGLAFVELWYRDALAAASEDPAIRERLAEAIEAAADAAADLSSAWHQLWDLVAQASSQPRAALPLPRDVQLGSETITLRRMEQSDAATMVQFARSLPSHDLLFLRRDITDPQQVEAWMRDAAEGLSETVLAFRGGELVGYATAVSDGLNWTRHVRELRVVVVPAMRGHGLGRLLTEQAFATAKAQGVKKMIAQMTTDQETALAVFERLGFEREARLRNHVMDRDGELHDLQIMSLDIDAFRAKLLAAISEPQEQPA